MRYVFILLLCSFDVIGSQCDPQSNKQSIYFSNGMFNEINDISISVYQLEKELSAFINPSAINYEISVNDSEQWLLQILEVAKQKLGDELSMFFIYLSSIDKAPEWFLEAVDEVVRSSFGNVNDQDLRQHVSEYQRAIDNCSKVLVIAHSQGNFYANSAWSQVYSRSFGNSMFEQRNFRSLGILSVATPSNYVGHQLLDEGDHLDITDYVTLTNDAIINIVRNSFPATLAGNVTNSNSSQDPLYHNFVSAYLAGDVSGSVIGVKTLAILDGLEPGPLKRAPVASSSLKSLAYLPNEQILEAEFVSDGSIYRYYGVPKSTYDALMTATSLGSYFYFNVRSSYRYKKVYEGNP
ncbi:KTSC domain-containing protein [Vibrio sonorensis]|uniref:KTSC domain-containing protein n=1 Tax=Vibrio sonorensis TaxID=1004316 RepID=UPI001C3119A3|nr:KTSC domain-containing protein [Vibrio sonorensis]